MRTRGWRPGGRLLAGGFLGALAAAATGLTPVFAANTNFLSGGGPAVDTIDMLFYVFLGCSVAVLIGVGGGIVFACIRFRRRSPDEMPRQIHGNRKIERAWVIGPLLLLTALFFLSAFTVGYLRNGPNPATPAGRNPVHITVTTQQFEWTFTYPNHKQSIGTLEIPVNSPILLTLSSKDVIHGFWVPQMGAKIDALPGIINHAFIEAGTKGTYDGQCYEFCGVGHYSMLITVKAVSMAQYESYLQSKS